MKICVCGYYFSDDWYGSLLRLNDKFPVHVVANRDDPFLKISELPFTIRKNIGLEFGAYNYYLDKLWDGKSDIIFCHDDIKFKPIGLGYEIVSGENVFYRLAELDCDQGYIFRNREDDVSNEGIHGRMIYISGRLLSWVKDNGGIWFDEKNSGITHVIEGVAEYNQGIHKFNEKMMIADKIGFDVNNKIYFSGLDFGHRGRFKGKLIA
jgi:hypothetical protein